MAWTIDNPELFFQAKLYSGTSSDQTITFDGSENMQADLIWVKRRNGTGGHGLVDSVRGANKWLASEGTGGEDTSTENITFGSNGFTWNGGNYDRNSSGETYVAWCWKAGGGSGSSNSDGSITSTVSASTTSGFSIVTWTGNSGSIGHGLGVKPAMIIDKSRGATGGWYVTQKSLSAEMQDNYMFLNTNSANTTNNDIWGGEPTTSTFSVGSGLIGDTTHVAYLWRSVQGFSKVGGSYKGNANANGPFVYTGFKPALITVKRYNSTGSWNVFDNKREGFNADNSNLYWNTDSGEQTDSDRANPIEFLSNGFKLRGTDTDVNGSSDTYIYMAFAESPFVNSNGVPNNAI